MTHRTHLDLFKTAEDNTWLPKPPEEPPAPLEPNGDLLYLYRPAIKPAPRNLDLINRKTAPRWPRGRWKSKT